MALPKKTKRLLEENLQDRLIRLDEQQLPLSVLVQISEAQERELMTYVVALPPRKFEKMVQLLRPRWQQYTEMKLRNRKRMRELAERGDQVERVN